MNTDIHKEIIYGIYARKSSESEDRQVQSIDRQLDELTETSARHNLVTIEPSITEKQSAFVPGREGFERLVTMTKKGRINAWLCYHANRLSRNSVDAGTIIYLMDLGKLDHIRTPSRIYHNNPTDKMMLQIEFTMSKKDSDDKSQFVKSGLNKRYKKGLPSGKAPIGFLNDKTGEKGDRKWLVDQDKFEKLKQLFDRFLLGNDSITTITEFAREQLLLTTPQHKRQGGKLVNRSLVEHILKNPIYAGMFYSKDTVGGLRTRRVLTETIPRIISKEEHFYLLEMLRLRTTPKVQRHHAVYSRFIRGSDGGKFGADHKFQLICDCKEKFAYRSIDRCPSCNIAISAMKRPKYLCYIYYYNLVRRKTKNVSAKAIEQRNVEALLIDYFKNQLHLPEDITLWIRHHLGEFKQAVSKEEQLQRTYKEHKRDDTAKQKQKLRELFAKGLITEEEFKSDYSSLGSEEKNLMVISKPKKDFCFEMNQLLDISNSCVKVIESGCDDAKRMLLSKFRSNLVWDEQNLSIIRPKWIQAFEMGRKELLTEYSSVEPKISYTGKGKSTPFGVPCPTLLRWLDTVRTLFEKSTNTFTLKEPHENKHMDITGN